jgi:3-oxoacyl-(acyl-carrier-protein) synthase
VERVIKKIAPVFINEHSSIHPYGVGIESLWEACEEEKKHFEDGLLYIPEEQTDHCRGGGNLFSRKTLLKEVAENKLLAWSLFCLRNLEEKSQLKWGPRDGLIIATTTGLTRVWESELINHFRGKKTEGILYQPIGGFAQEIRHQLDHQGPIQIVSSACAAGTQAIGLGRNWLNLGLVDRCVVLGAEQICDLTRTGFSSLSLVNGEDCLPFNETRSGICLSEAVGALVLEKEKRHEHSVSIVGYGCASDGYSMTAPKPDGSGPLHSISQALDDAALTSEDLDWVHAHGTGSLQNDRAEAAAIKHLEIKAPVSSTKGIHGHSLAASGVWETLLCCESLKRQQILRSAFSEPKHFTINLARENQDSKISYILKNTLGFGGINASLILGREA